jgi:glycosidase
MNHYPKQTLDCLMNILGTHDTYRILTVLGGITCNTKKEMSLPTAYLSKKEKEKAVSALKMAAVLQYTMPGVPCIYYGDENAMEGHSDPFCRRCFDWEHMEQNLIEFYQKLGNIRKANPVIGTGKQRIIDTHTCVRYNDKDTLVIRLAVDAGEKINLGGAFPNDTVVTELYTGQTATVENGTVTFPRIENCLAVIK